MNRFNTDYPWLESMLDDDISDACEAFNKRWEFDAKLVDLDIKLIDIEEFVSQTLEVTAKITCEDLNFDLKFNVIDDVEHNEYEYPEITKNDIRDAYQYRYYMSMNQRYDADHYKEKLQRADISVVYGATAITAAGEDDSFEDSEDLGDLEDLDDPGAISDSIDDMADTLDDLSDSIDRFEEDDVRIDLENNITNHYIAECEKCHGIFITAVTESDQEIDHISGVCPLCDREGDQYLNWIIRDASENNKLV